MQTPSIHFGMALSKHIRPSSSASPLGDRINKRRFEAAISNLTHPRSIQDSHPSDKTKDAVLIAHGTDPAAKQDRLTIENLQGLQSKRDQLIKWRDTAQKRKAFNAVDLATQAETASTKFKTAFQTALDRASNLVLPA